MNIHRNTQQFKTWVSHGKYRMPQYGQFTDTSLAGHGGNETLGEMSINMDNIRNSEITLKLLHFLQLNYYTIQKCNHTNLCSNCFW